MGIVIQTNLSFFKIKTQNLLYLDKIDKMKQLTSLLALILVFFTACKEQKKTGDNEPAKEMTVLEKVAYAHGYENWKNVETLKFTFNVDRDTSHFERKWTWHPKTNDVVGISAGDTVTYNRKALDSMATKVDPAFINDKFWLLAPFNLIWDQESFTYQHDTIAQAPIAKKSMQKLTIVYGADGGYTPGDAYDFYFGDDYKLKEWVFRKSNQPNPSMITTWEDYKVLDGLVIAEMHKKADEDFKLYLSDITVKTE